jgi:SAM-dependent methyltransferase
MQITKIMGERQHRAWVGPPDYYDRLGALQFVKLLMLGMRENDTLLDIGCGSLRGGRFSLLYLNAGNYFGIEPEEWCLTEGITAEIGNDLIKLKKPTFSSNNNFDARHFDREFDYVMAAGIFMHACLDQAKMCFLSISQVLAPNGIFVGAYLTGDTDSQESTWTYPHIQQYKSATIASLAENCGLRLSFLEAPHPLDHQWFVATPSTSSRDIVSRLDMEVFSWREYLANQLRMRGGVPQSYEYYLKSELKDRIAVDDAAVVPQARL